MSLSNTNNTPVVVKDYLGVLITLPVDSIGYKHARYVDHVDGSTHNCGLGNGWEAFDTEIDGTTPLNPAPQMQSFAGAVNEFDDSNDFNKWTKTRIVVTENNANGPDGTLSADSVVPSVDNNSHRSENFLDSVLNTDYVMYVLIKAGDKDKIVIATETSTPADTPNASIFDLTNNTVLLKGSNHLNAGVESGYAEGFKLIWVHFKGQGLTSKRYIVAGCTSNTLSGLTYAGDAVTPDFYLWHAQREKGLGPTPPIYTKNIEAVRDGDNIKTAQTATNFYNDKGIYVRDWVLGHDSDIALQAILSGIPDNSENILSLKGTALTSNDGSAELSLNALSLLPGDRVKAAVVWSAAESSYAISYSVDVGASWTAWSSLTYDGQFSAKDFHRVFEDNLRGGYLNSIKIYHPEADQDMAKMKTWVEQNS